MEIQSCLTIIFDGTFYKAVWERHDGQNYSVATVTLGSSVPKLPVISKLITKNYHQFSFYRITDTSSVATPQHINPKRAQRLASKALKQQTPGSKAQKALQKQLEAQKKARKLTHSILRKATKEERFKTRVIKHRQKHRGH